HRGRRRPRISGHKPLLSLLLAVPLAVNDTVVNFRDPRHASSKFPQEGFRLVVVRAATHATLQRPHFPCRTWEMMHLLAALHLQSMSHSRQQLVSLRQFLKIRTADVALVVKLMQ